MYTIVLVTLLVKMDSACQEIINRLNERNLLFLDHFWLNDEDTWKDVWTVKKKKKESPP